MCELGVDSVETLFLALPENLQGEENLKVLKGFWEVRNIHETLVISNCSSNIGKCIQGKKYFAGMFILKIVILQDPYVCVQSSLHVLSNFFMIRIIFGMN